MAASRKSIPKRKTPRPPSASELRRDLAHATEGLLRLVGESQRFEWEIGTRLNAIDQLELYRAGRHASIVEYADAALKLGRTRAYVLMRVAGFFDADTVSTLGAERLDRGLAYIARTPEDEEPSDVPTMRVAVPSDDGSTVVRKAFAECTVTDLKRAIARLAGAPGDDMHIAGDVVRAIGAAHRALDASVGKEDASRAVVTIRRVDGRVLVDVRGVPFERLEVALRAVVASVRTSMAPRRARAEKAKARTRTSAGESVKKRATKPKPRSR